MTALTTEREPAVVGADSEGLRAKGTGNQERFASTVANQEAETPPIMKTGFKKVLISETGASMIEYVMMAALIAVVAISSVEAVGEENRETMALVAQTMHTAGTGVPDDDIIDDEW